MLQSHQPLAFLCSFALKKQMTSPDHQLYYTLGRSFHVYASDVLDPIWNSLQAMERTSHDEAFQPHNFCDRLIGWLRFKGDMAQ
jgi:hypothetical protein